MAVHKFLVDIFTYYILGNFALGTMNFHCPLWKTNNCISDTRLKIWNII